MKTFKLYMIRHGITQGNLEGKYIGSTDLPLCEQGREEIETLVDTCEYPRVQKVYCSPLKRAVETADIIYPDTFIQKVDALKEYDFGVFENQSLEQLKEDAAFQEWMEGDMDTAPPQGESKEQFQKRLEFGINQIFMDMMQNDITSAALITHGGVIAALLAAYGLPQRGELEWQTKSGKGYTVMTYTQLWMRDQFFEVYDPIPYSTSEDDFSSMQEYSFWDIEEQDEEIE
ncbi:histidine phosphatase family protein [Massilioclostridium coli]|uniref:histidine phosphatase family protein n=1 Tax=Massilioclostridium coli TaxID=1870991 RepID=UPI00085C2064|nr:histidine phosphatase family protein [Massilioclostridium coli]